jgi:hypothetical protein
MGRATGSTTIEVVSEGVRGTADALDSVIATVDGVRERLVAEATGALGNGVKWMARPNVGSLTIGTTLVTVNVYGASGKRGVATETI